MTLKANPSLPVEPQKAEPPIAFFSTEASATERGDSRLPVLHPAFDFRLAQNCRLQLSGAPCTHYGFVYDGEGLLRIANREHPVVQGMYFTAAGDVCLDLAGEAIVVSQKNHCGLFSLGGPIEEEGRLRYIDGCSDTLLIPPLLMGDACLNFLKIPPHTHQTSHTHPSFRFGMIVAGAGWCDSPAGFEELTPGKLFFIPADGTHRFRTEEKSLSVIAFHPDSDFGPEDDNHPMVNKTIVNGVSAAELSHEQRGISATEDAT